MTMPYYQGALDGLCGVYNIVNSVSLLYEGVDADDLFKGVIGFLDDRRLLLGALCEGMPSASTLGSIFKWIEAEKGIVIKRAMPFIRNREVGLDEFWSAMQDHLAVNVGDSFNATVLLGISGVHDHWTVTARVTEKQIQLHDSDGLSVLNRRNCTTKDGKGSRHHELNPYCTYFLSK